MMSIANGALNLITSIDELLIFSFFHDIFYNFFLFLNLTELLREKAFSNVEKLVKSIIIEFIKCKKIKSVIIEKNYF